MLTETHLYREIEEQPAAIDRFLTASHSSVQALAVQIKKAGISHVVIAARGTSDNAGRYAKYVLGAFNRLQVSLATPSLFTHYQTPPRFERALVLGISQSGQSPDIVAVLAEARQQGALTAAITNNPDSNLAREADIVIDLVAGPELAVAATKTYTAELAAVALLSATLADDQARLDALQQMPTHMQQTLAITPAVAEIASRYRYMSHCVVIGRGFNYATAFETALKLKELTYTIVEPYSSADFLHGPFAMLHPGFPIILNGPSGALNEDMLEFVTRLKGSGAELIAISDLESVLQQARIPLKLPVTVPEWLSPLTTIIPGQLLALHLAHERDLDVDSPRNIQKVTETV